MSLRVQKDVFGLQVPVDNVQGVQVAQSAGDFSSVETGTRFQKAPFPLQVIEQLQKKEREQERGEKRLSPWTYILQAIFNQRFLYSSLLQQWEEMRVYSTERYNTHTGLKLHHC